GLVPLSNAASGVPLAPVPTVDQLTATPPAIGDAAAAEPDAANAPAAAGGGDLTINFVGDIQLAEVPAALLDDNAPFGFDRVAALVRDADLTFANLECPVSNRGAQAAKTFTFRAAPASLRALNMLGIDAVGLANNHVLDFGTASFLDTIRNLDAIGMPHAGAGATAAAAHAPVILERNGVRVAYLALSSIMPQGGPGGMVASLSEASVRADIAAARQQADIVIVAMHMGVEQPQLTDLQLRFARAAIAAGADIVHGHHPHCLLGFERSGRGLIAYSMGNFLFGHSGRSFRDTGLLRVTIRDRRVATAQVVPLRDKDGPGSCYIPLLPDAENRARILTVLDGHSRRTGTRVDRDGFITAAE
ncbi:MAG TPA: CapA family protein, partial [bacterium]|nr:CapA family protein [bacterium]